MLGLPDDVSACLFDMDGVVTQILDSAGLAGRIRDAR